SRLLRPRPVSSSSVEVPCTQPRNEPRQPGHVPGPLPAVGDRVANAAGHDRVIHERIGGERAPRPPPPGAPCKQRVLTDRGPGCAAAPAVDGPAPSARALERPVPETADGIERLPPHEQVGGLVEAAVALD